MKKLAALVITVIFNAVTVFGQSSKPLHKYISTVTWKGARVWRSENTTTVDSVISMNFSSTGTVTWNKQGWEFVPQTAGTFIVKGNNIKITFRYPPYAHQIDADYDPATGRLTGTFREERLISPGAPGVYIPGTTTGEIVLFWK